MSHTRREKIYMKIHLVSQFEFVLIFQGQGHLQAVLSYMSGRQISEACSLAQQSGDHRLAMLLAQASGSNITRKMLARQLANWQEHKVSLIYYSWKKQTRWHSCRVPTAQGKWPKKNPCLGKHREFGNVGKTQGILSKHRENTENFVSSSCKCSDFKRKGYCDSRRKKNTIFFQKLDRFAKSVLCM